MLSGHNMAPHKDRPMKTASPRLGLLENLMLQTMGTALPVKRRSSIVTLDVGLRSNIKMQTSHLVRPTDMTRTGKIKATSTMAEVDATEAGAKLGVEGGRPRNGHRADQ